jgi:hypothetical protein
MKSIEEIKVEIENARAEIENEMESIRARKKKDAARLLELKAKLDTFPREKTRRARKPEVAVGSNGVAADFDGETTSTGQF